MTGVRQERTYIGMIDDGIRVNPVSGVTAGRIRDSVFAEELEEKKRIGSQRAR